MKPMLADDWDAERVKYPGIAQPKIDGVRALNLFGVLTGRSLKKHRNQHTTKLYSHSALIGFDGELAAESETHPDLCRITSSAVSTIAGTPFTLWWLFDYITDETLHRCYLERYNMLRSRLTYLQQDPSLRELVSHLRLVPMYEFNNRDELEELDARFLEEGYEGTIIRDPNGKYKHGRSTIKEGGLLRIKRFIEADAVVTAIVEGETNENEAQINELGRQFRSSHQAGKVKNGMVGSLLCNLTEDVRENAAGRTLFVKGQEITVSPGNMTAQEREDYFKHPEKLVGKTIKFKFFPKGIKDKPRFPGFQSIRAASDKV